MKIDEFINTYSDDLITIHEARAAAYTHPLRGDYALADSLLDASFCRILAVFVVGSIEAMLESWRDRDDARGFPTDTQMLKKDHLDKIEHVNQNMMFYIALTALTKPDSPRPAKLVRLDETMTRRKDETGILRIRDMERIIWNNLERIDAYI